MLLVNGYETTDALSRILAQIPQQITMECVHARDLRIEASSGKFDVTP